MSGGVFPVFDRPDVPIVEPVPAQGGKRMLTFDRTMFRRVFFATVWLGFLAYAFLYAPPERADTADLIVGLSTGQIDGIEPILVSLFNLMGILPAIYSCLIYLDGRCQTIRAWPFALASFAVGGFALLPYLAIRNDAPKFQGPMNRWLGFWDARLVGVAVTVAFGALAFAGLSQGDWSAFVHEWQTRRFVNVMSLDFVLLVLGLPALIHDDMQRRGIQNRTLFWAITFLPIVGPLLYLCLRPRQLAIE